MAVEVIRGHNQLGDEVLERYEAGTEVVVIDGHMFVNDAPGYALAIFAPGKWQFARVVQDSAEG